LNHLDHFRLWLQAEYGEGEGLIEGIASAVQAQPAFQRVKRRPADLEAIRRDFSIAWQSELQLALPALLGSPEMARYANAWAPVHVYYAVYLSMQAWFEANKIAGVSDDHSASLRTIATQIRDRRLFPPPWSVLAVGCPMRKERLYLNAPADADLAGDVEVLSNPALEEFWPRYGTWLRSTRRARLLAREEAWKTKNGKARVSPAVRTKFAQTVWPTSFFDCLWRLRIRSNYKDIEPYLVRFVSDSQATRFHEATRVCVSATLALLELYVAQAVGGPEFASIAGAFLEADERGLAADTIGRRFAAYQRVAPFVVRA
ncbi:MAG: hypothetical protein M3P18_07080, partial [Actinomycetota bacterium]|nr:hypothetical protein [Actinomycetota bacterium]